MSLASRNAKIVVVGAGFAGLTAATSLVQAGFQDVKILEAKDRVGGRVHTTKPFTDNIIELGANWVHGQDGNPVFQLAKEHDLLVEDRAASEVMCSPHYVTPQDYFFREGGIQVPADAVDQVCSLFSTLMTKAFESELEDKHRALSLGSYLDECFAQSSLASSQEGLRIYEWCKRSECTDEASSSLYEVSASQIGYYIALEGGFFNSLGCGGYQAILDVLMKSLPMGTILNNTTVKNIQWNLSTNEDPDLNHPVRLICEEDQIFEANHVIVTVSLGVLKEQAKAMFTPALPKSKLDAIKRLGFGTVDKIFLCFSERFWPDDCAGIQLVWDEGPEDKSFYSTHDDGDTWKQTWFKKITGFDTVARHATVLCGWITGREALHMETLQDKEVGDTCVRLLRSFTGWSVPEVSQVLISRWGHDAHVLGSYTFVPHMVNGVKEHEALAEPLPFHSNVSKSKPLQVLFAGEATHVNFYTTTHGAYMSGVREAQRLINHYTHKACL